MAATTTKIMATHHHSGPQAQPSYPYEYDGHPQQQLPANIKISLHRRQNSLSQYQSTCISKHYALNNQILAAFESHYRNELLKVAFHLGLKFVETALLEIPKHGYFYSSKHSALRLQSSSDAIRVTQLLQEIADRESCFASERTKIEKLSLLAHEQYERLPTYETKRSKVEQELYPAVSNWYNNHHRRSGSFTRSSNADPLTSTFLACGDSFASVFCPQQGAVTDSYHEYKSAFPDDVPRSYSDPHSYSAPGGYSHDGFPRSSTDPAALMLPSSKKRTYATDTVSLSSEDSPIKKREEYKFPPLPAGPSFTEQREPSFENRSSSTSSKSKSAASSNDAHLKLKQTGSLLDDDNGAEEDFRSESQSSSDGGSGHRHKYREQPIPTEVHKAVPLVVELPPKPPKTSSTSSGRPPLGKPPLLKPSKTATETKSSSWRRHREEEKLFGEEKVPEAPHHVRSQSDYDLQRALFLSGLGVQLGDHRHPSDVSIRGIPSDSADDESQSFAPPGARKRGKDELPISLLSQYHHEDFDALRDNGRVIVSHVPTYQGRIPDSTNGCTVISPLLCLHHFHSNSNQIPDNGLEDQIIVEVLDEETPNILPLVRKKLGLVQDAFLIPADAHEALMEEQYMCPEQFFSVCGGNILEEQHLDAFIKEISQIRPEKKLAATFFFHEHVIAILQLKRGRNRVWFDLINSLPNGEMFSRAGDTVDGLHGECLVAGSGPDDMRSSMRLSSEGIDFGASGGFMIDATFPPENACRIRCLDGEALKATLKWYASSSFTDADQAYIDKYQWDENLSDFDPRVFQSFIWKEA